MTIEDQDFIMRQVKLMAKGIGVFMSLTSLKELLKLEFSFDDDELTDQEIDGIIYLARTEELIDKNILSKKELEEALGVSSERVDQLLNNEATPNGEERDILEQLIEDNQYWMNQDETDL
ncbi:hypothetical protein [Alkalibacterium pelagium]|uniref:Uncharacterized protein n=1 Tax=Alkalibacterium pelagium TaxID=426702 RepID=A0A1H7JUW4_9LACT|nr:hypothetical protein [Alkalibacterium pelagium]GEN50537.1 hypothetical protein APE02nite_12020 [Alkalibacterium pelagium]SEK78322.1 hypothetical protein SAMN04488099_10674 [Alkalibacterium pelagium]